MLGLKPNSRLMMISAASAADTPLLASTIHTSTPSLSSSSSRNTASSLTTKNSNSDPSSSSAAVPAAPPAAAPPATTSDKGTSSSPSLSSAPAITSSSSSSSSPSTKVVCSDTTTSTQCIELQLLIPPPPPEEQTQPQQPQETETATIATDDSSKMFMVPPPPAPRSLESETVNGINLDYICQQIRDGMRDYSCVSDLKLVFQTPTAMMRKPPSSSSSSLPKLPKISLLSPTSKKISPPLSWKKPLIRQSSSTSTSCSSDEEEEEYPPHDPTAAIPQEEVQRILAEREELKKRLRESCYEVDQLKVQVKLLTAEKDLATKKLQLHLHQEHQQRQQQHQQSSSCPSPPVASPIQEKDSQDEEPTDKYCVAPSLKEGEGEDEDLCSSSDTTAVAANHKKRRCSPSLSPTPSPATATPLPTPLPVPSQPPLTAAALTLTSSSSEENDDMATTTNHFNQEVLDTLRRVKLQLEETVVAQRAKIDSLSSINHQQRQQLLVRSMVDESDAIDHDISDIESQSSSVDLLSAVDQEEQQQDQQQKKEDEAVAPKKVTQAGTEAVLLAEEVAAAAVGLSQLEELENLWDQQQAQCATIQQTQDQMFRQLGKQNSEATTKIDKLCNSIGALTSTPTPTPSKAEDLQKQKKEKPLSKEEQEEKKLLQLIMEEDENDENNNNNPLHDSDSSYNVIAKCEQAWMQQTQEIEELQRQQDRVLARLRRSTSSGDQLDDVDAEQQQQQEEAVSRALQPLYSHQRVDQDDIVKQPAPAASAAVAKVDRGTGTSSDDDVLQKKPLPSTSTTATQKDDDEKQELIQKLKEADSNVVSAQDRLDSYSQKISKLELVCQNQESTLEKLQKDNETLMQTCEKLQNQLKETEETCEGYRSKISKLREEKVTIIRDHEVQTHRFEKGQAVAEQQRETIVCLQKECRTLEELLQDQRFRTKGLEEECASQKAVIEELQAAKDDLTNRFLQNQDEFRKHLTKNLSWQGQVKELRSKLERVKALRSKLADEVSSVVHSRSMDDSERTPNLNIGEVSFQTNVTDLTSFDEEDHAAGVSSIVGGNNSVSHCLVSDVAAVSSPSTTLPPPKEKEVVTIVEASVSGVNEGQKEKAVREALHILQLLSFAAIPDDIVVENEKEQQSIKIQESPKIDISVGCTVEEEDSFMTAMEDSNSGLGCKQREYTKKIEEEEENSTKSEETTGKTSNKGIEEEETKEPVVVQLESESFEVMNPDPTPKTEQTTVVVGSDDSPKNECIPKESIRTHARKLLAKDELPRHPTTPESEEEEEDDSVMKRFSSTPSIRTRARSLLEQAEIVSSSATDEPSSPTKSAVNVLQQMSSAVCEDGNDTECSLEESDSPPDASSLSSFENSNIISNNNTAPTAVTTDEASTSSVESDKEKLAAEDVLRFLSFSVACGC